MIEMTPLPNMTDEQVEAWFAAAGLSVSVVEHCPSQECRTCVDHAVPTAA